MHHPSVTSIPSRDRLYHPHLPRSASSSTTTCPDLLHPSSDASGSGSSYNTDSNHFSNHSISPYADSRAGPVTAFSSSSHRTRYQFSSDNDTAIPNHPPSSADSRFDSLQDLLERAGYKETRVVTPDRQSLAGMFAKKLATPPRKPRLVDDFSSDSPSLAASELRRAIQKSAAAGRSTPKPSATSKSLPSRNYKLSDRNDPPSVPPLPNAPALSAGWFSNIWLFGPGTIFDDASNPASTSDSSKDIGNHDAPQQDELVSTSLASTTASTSASTTARAPPTAAKRTATKNPVWTASVAYRSAKSRTAPVRKSAAISSDVLNSDAAAEEAWKALHNGGSNATAKRRPGLVDAFSSPTKKSVGSGKARETNGSPSRQRKWGQERAAWRESLGDLQAMMDQSRMRREAATVVENTASATSGDNGDDASSSGRAYDTDPAPIAARSDDDAVAKLLSGPALPFLSTDPAVAPRNASCTRPTHLSMRRMKSVEVLSKIMRERRTVTTTSSTDDSPLSSQNSRTSFEVDMQSGQISPTLEKRSTPPRLTVSSPRGISSPKELALEGQEFEPMSWSPSKCEGAIIIPNRRVQKKPRSKLRHVSSGSDLRSAAAAEGLKIRRGRSKSRTADSPSKTTTRGPVAALTRDSVGTLSRGTQVAALRTNVNVFDSDGAEPIDDSPTRRTSHRILALSHAPNQHPTRDEDDIFRPTIKKKDFSARITRTSKIMRLIDEAENIPSIASIITNEAPRPIAHPRPTPTDNSESAGLSSSLSRKSRQRMHTITRVLGQKQPAS
ncbi:uncharacterized protein SPSC_06536 [Sporisorium scitamineum]|uniref:Uncharacterized protein n=1 Tax=Sporisorium scitamineum TaxID=49012 RepID=A0A0F7RU87_9BASI|nr:hypothetical protein [Sporisorium scitamineum]CDU26342.1 uncharacterized protein SPSC_06536 [Sporisorium scitamineum]